MLQENWVEISIECRRRIDDFSKIDEKQTLLKTMKWHRIYAMHMTFTK